MTSKTHITASAAITTAIINPDTTKYLAICLIASTIGSIISDADLTTTDIHKDLDKIFAISILSIIICIIADYFCNLGILEFVKNQINSNNVFIGILLFLLICILGIHTSHRSFMHSFLGVALLSFSVYLILPMAVLPFSLAMISHILLDLLNHKGVQLFFPFKKKFALKLCSSDGIINNILCVCSVIAFIFILYI